MMPTLSPLDGRYQALLQELTALLSEEALMKARLFIEIEWLISLKDTPLQKTAPRLSEEQIAALRTLATHCQPADIAAIKTIEKTTRHDVKAVEYWLREALTAQQLTAYIPWIHFACTSEDINNLAYAQLFTQAHQVLSTKLQTLIETLTTLATQSASYVMLARTHGQSATPTTFGKEMAIFAYRLKQILQPMHTYTLSAKINGAVGNFNALYFLFPDFDWLGHAQHFVEGLGFQFNPYTTQVESKDVLCRLFSQYVHLNTVLLDCCRDMWQYLSVGYCTLKTRQGEVGSSTMPHKVNPIDFENAEGNLGLANALFIHYIEKLPISRQQRDLSDSTVMRNVAVAFGHAYLAYHHCHQGLQKIVPHAANMQDDLQQHWEVLAEAVQTLLRARGLAEAYEATKAHCHTRMDAEDYQHLISTLPLSAEDHQRLRQLTPRDYSGIACYLAQEVQHILSN